MNRIFNFRISSRMLRRSFIQCVLSGLLATLMFAGCQHTYEESRVGESSGHPRLNPDAIGYVAIPPDARFKRGFAQDSGKSTAHAVREEFAKYFRRAYVGRKIESFEEGLEMARAYQWSYYVYPTVLRWEDRATENSGRRDRLEIQIQVVETVSGDILDTTILKGTSRWMTAGGDTPGDLLNEPIRNYVASLFNPIATPSALQ